MDPVGLGKPVLDEGGQVFLVPDQFVIVTEARMTDVLFEQRGIILDCLGSLPQLLKRREHVAGLVDRFKLYVEGGDEGQVVSKWPGQRFHSFDDTSCPVHSVSFQERTGRDDP